MPKEEKEIEVANKLVYFLPCCCWAMTCGRKPCSWLRILCAEEVTEFRRGGDRGGEERIRTHALDNLGLLDEEGTDDALADAVGAARATVRALDRLDALRDLRVLARAKGRDLQNKDDDGDGASGAREHA